MNVRTEQFQPAHFSDFIVGVDEWDFHYTKSDGTWHVHLQPLASENNRKHGRGWSYADRKHPTEEQFSFARSFLSLTQ